VLMCLRLPHTFSKDRLGCQPSAKSSKVFTRYGVQYTHSFSTNNCSRHISIAITLKRTKLTQPTQPARYQPLTDIWLQGPHSLCNSTCSSYHGV